MEYSTQNLSFELGYKAHQFSFIVIKLVDNLLQKSLKLSFSQFLIIFALCSEEEKPSQKQIANILDITEAAVSRHIQTLIKIGLMERTVTTEDKREYDLRLSKKGKNVFKKGLGIIENEMDSIFSVLNTHEQQSFNKTLDKLIYKLCPDKK